MKKNWKLIAILTLMIILIIVLIIATWLSKKYQNGIESVVIEKNSTINYKKVIIQDLDEYQEILNKYNILGKLTSNDFKNNDYILDVIPYQDNLEIINITINIGSNNDVIVNYKTNPKISDDNNKILINFIPIQKGILNDNMIISSEY